MPFMPHLHFLDGLSLSQLDCFSLPLSPWIDMAADQNVNRTNNVSRYSHEGKEWHKVSRPLAKDCLCLLSSSASVQQEISILH